MATSVVCFGIILMMLFLKIVWIRWRLLTVLLKARVLKELHVLNDSNTFTRQVYRIGGYMSFDNYT